MSMIPLVLLIDGENISRRFAASIMAEANKHGVIAAKRVYGNEHTLQRWQPMMNAWGMQGRKHQGGKNAADTLLLEDAHRFVQEQGIRRCCLVTNDGGFVSGVHQLQALGCQIIGIGTTSAAKRLREACLPFVSLEASPDPGIRDGDSLPPIYTEQPSSSVQKGTPMSKTPSWHIPAASASLPVAPDASDTSPLSKNEEAISALYPSKRKSARSQCRPSTRSVAYATLRSTEIQKHWSSSGPTVAV